LVGALATRKVVVPLDNLDEARVVGRCEVIGVRTLHEVIDALSRKAPWPSQPPGAVCTDTVALPDIGDVRGQALARAAVEVAAAGGHHLLMVGPPGAGKTMLARRLPGLLPPLSPSEAIEVSCIHSAAGVPLPRGGLVCCPPFRAPHHGASTVSLVGGGTMALRPGEISLAHCGVLFLDELGEFSAVALDSLRQPLEDGVIRLSRAHGSAVLPSRFVLIAAMNPCPCGASGGPGVCRCSTPARARYHRRVSGPLLDRFDLRVDVQRPDPQQLIGGAPGESSDTVRARVMAARNRAAQRGVRANVELDAAQLDRHARMTLPARGQLEHALCSGTLSGRGYHRVRAVALTLADLSGSDHIEREHLAQALQLRSPLVESVFAEVGNGR
jgi:magnesium chelatase family protein